MVDALLTLKNLSSSSTSELEAALERIESKVAEVPLRISATAVYKAKAAQARKVVKAKALLDAFRADAERARATVGQFLADHKDKHMNMAAISFQAKLLARLYTRIMLLRAKIPSEFKAECEEETDDIAALLNDQVKRLYIARADCYWKCIKGPVAFLANVLCRQGTADEKAQKDAVGALNVTRFETNREF